MFFDTWEHLSHLSQRFVNQRTPIQSQRVLALSRTGFMISDRKKNADQRKTRESSALPSMRRLILVQKSLCCHEDTGDWRGRLHWISCNRVLFRYQPGDNLR